MQIPASQPALSLRLQPNYLRFTSPITPADETPYSWSQGRSNIWLAVCIEILDNFKSNTAKNFFCYRWWSVWGRIKESSCIRVRPVKSFIKGISWLQCCQGWTIWSSYKKILRSNSMRFLLLAMFLEHNVLW